MIRLDLREKNCLVTGASRGIGQRIAVRLAEAGGRVVVHHRDNDDGAQQTAREMESSAVRGCCAGVVQGDLRESADVGRLITEAIDHFGHGHPAGIDVLVNNAGVGYDRTLRKMPAEKWYDVINTNLSGTMHVTKSGLPYLREYGRIINIASVAAVAGFDGQTAYGAAKAGIVSMTKTWAKELARRRVTVNAVAPGVIPTEMSAKIPQRAQERLMEMIPLRRYGELVEVADVVVFLASPLASYITGQTIHVNGGMWAP